MHVRELSATSHTHILDKTHFEDRGLGTTTPDMVIRQELAGLPGCHPERREQARVERRMLMLCETLDVLDVAYWYDVKFIEPRPEDLTL